MREDEASETKVEHVSELRVHATYSYVRQSPLLIDAYLYN